MIKIRNHEKKDIPLRLKWLNNPKVNKWAGQFPGQKTTLKKQEKWFSDYIKDKNKKFFTICDDNFPIGFMGLSNIKNSETDIFIAIGEDKYRGKGYGKQALNWLINYAFDKLSLGRVYLGVFEGNTRAVNLYKKLGFKIDEEKLEEIDNRKYKFYSMVLENKLYK